jgi:hypothetical protein
MSRVATESTATSLGEEIGWLSVITAAVRVHEGKQSRSCCNKDEPQRNRESSGNVTGGEKQLVSIGCDNGQGRQG